MDKHIENWDKKRKGVNEDFKYPSTLNIVILQHNSVDGQKPTYCISSYLYFDFLNEYVYSCSMRDISTDIKEWIDKFKELGWPTNFII